MPNNHISPYFIKSYIIKIIYKSNKYKIYPMNSIFSITYAANTHAQTQYNSLSILALIFICYLIGSINSAIILCKLYGLPSPRSQGSKNPGATNIMRIAGKKLAALTFMCDALKAIIPIAICKYLLNLPDLILILSACLIILGHMFPIFFEFKGGRGVATFFGALIIINIWVALMTIATWLIIATTLRISSVAAIIACILCPLYTWYFVSPNSALAMCVISILIILKHYDNIKTPVKRPRKIL